MYQPNYLNPPPPINNPLLSQQQRLLQLEQQQNMMNNNMMPPSYQQPQGIYLKGRAVTGIEEVRGTIIDQNGSLFIFPDIGHNKIYTKQINIDGTATINSFALFSLIRRANASNVTIFQQKRRMRTQQELLELFNLQKREHTATLIG